MKIISKFRDYYDTAAGYGVDETQYLKRETKEVRLKVRKDWDWLTFLSRRLPRRGFAIGKVYLAFCGKTYAFAKCTYNGTVTYLHTLSELEHYMNNNEEVSNYLERADLAKYFDVDTDVSKTLNAMCMELKIPYLLCDYTVLDGVKITAYPVLKSLRFASVVGPYTAFQEIAMYKFGVLGEDEGMKVEISDKDRIAGKGFDTKYGFRTRPN